MEQHNDRISTREFLEARLLALERMLDARFDALTDKVIVSNERALSMIEDHEMRIRSLEKKSVWGNVADAILAIGTAVGAWLGMK